MPIAADVFGYCRQRNHLRQVGCRQARQQAGDGVAVLRNERALGAPLGAVAENIQRTAAQAAQLRKDAERTHHPRPEFALDQVAMAVTFGQQRRRHMKFHLVVAFEHVRDLAGEGGVGMQPRDFILVLVGHELEVVARHRLGQPQRLAALDHAAFGLPHLRHEVAVLRRIRRVLVVGQECDAASDHVVQRRRALELDDLRRRAGAGQFFHRGHVMRSRAAPDECLAVEVHRHAVELDGFQHRRLGQRHPALLPRIAQHEHIGGNGVAHQRGGDAAGVDELGATSAAGAADVLLGAGFRELPVGVAHEGGGRRAGGVDHRMRTALAHARQCVAAGGDDFIAADHEVSRAGAHAGREDLVRMVGQAHMRQHRPALLRQSAHVQHRTALAFDVRGHGQDLAHGHHTRAADAGDEYPVRLLRVGQDRGRQAGLRRCCPGRVSGGLFRLFQRAAFHRHEARAKAVDAGIVLVAGRLVDLALAAKLGFQRLHRQAVGLHAAVAAAFADCLVDDHALGRVRVLVAFAAAPLFGCAGLVVDHGRDALHFAQFALHRVELAAMAYRHARRPVDAGGVLVRLVGHHDDGVDAFRCDLARDHRRVERPVHGLAAGHGDGVVVQDLVGDVDLAGHRGADCQQAGVVIGAVAQVGEHMLFAGEGRRAYPGRALGAHMGEGRGLAVHPQRHVMAAYAGQRAAAFGHPGRGVVRAAGTEMRNAVPGRVRRTDFQHRFLGFQVGDALAHTLLDRVAGKVARHPAGNGARDLRRVEFIGRRQQPVAVAGLARIAPFAGVVELADHARAHVVAPVVEFFLDLVFEDLAFFLDHQDFLQPLRELAHAFGFQRPGHADLVETDADVARDGFVDAQVSQRLARVEVGLAGGDDADLRYRAVPDDAVELVDAGIGQRGIPLVIVHPRFLLQHPVRPADVEAAFRQLEVLRQHDLHPVRVEVDRGARLDDVGHALHRDPEAGVAAHRPAMQAIIEVFLHGGRVQHRNAAGLQDVLALVRGSGGLGRVVVAGQDQHAAMRAGASHVGMLEHVAAAVHARALAVPHAEDAVVQGAFEQVDLLRAPDAGGGQVFIDAGMKAHMLRVQIFLRLHRGLVDAAQGRAAIAGHETGGVEAGARVADALLHRQPDQRLRAGQEGAAAFERVLVIQGNRSGRRLPIGRKGCIHAVSMPKIVSLGCDFSRPTTHLVGGPSRSTIIATLSPMWAIIESYDVILMSASSASHPAAACRQAGVPAATNGHRWA